MPTQDFTRGNSPPQAENFGILSPILRGESGQNRQPRKPPNLADPENPPLVNSQIEDKGGFSARERTDMNLLIQQSVTTGLNFVV